MTDALGSVLSTFSNVAGTAAIQGNQVYDPYGTNRYNKGSMSTTKGFTGQYNDALTGLDYYNARYYDPVVGLFLSADLEQGNNMGMDPYAYVDGNPETNIDPTGKRICGLENGLSGCVGGGAPAPQPRKPQPLPPPPQARTTPPHVTPKVVTKSSPEVARTTSNATAVASEPPPSPCPDVQDYCTTANDSPGADYLKDSGAAQGNEMTFVGTAGLDDLIHSTIPELATYLKDLVYDQDHHSGSLEGSLSGILMSFGGLFAFTDQPIAWIIGALVLTTAGAAEAIGSSLPTQDTQFNSWSAVDRWATSLEEGLKQTLTRMQKGLYGNRTDTEVFVLRETDIYGQILNRPPNRCQKGCLPDTGTYWVTDYSTVRYASFSLEMYNLLDAHY